MPSTPENYVTLSGQSINEFMFLEPRPLFRPTAYCAVIVAVQKLFSLYFLEP
jgi:hypothetical protein